MGKINLLDKEISELIAAGEVIDRPSAIVKELTENAIDSGAGLITVEIKNGGRTFIRVTDNGAGIAYEDVPTAFLRHATSKISSRADLDDIMTLGFRGEALASICAVAKVDVLTKRAEDALGCKYRICANVEEEYEQTGCPDGTTVIVRDIFYNVPARLKFLKKDVTEGNAIAAIVTKLALSHPDISFRFIRDNKNELLTAGDGKYMSAVYCVFGREFASTLVPVDYSYNGVKVTGFTCKPLMAKANHSFQNFFINKRYVKSLTCMHAVDEAYANQIMTGKVPSCVLYLEIQPQMVDVNVHPTKIEVRFTNEKLVYDSVYFAVKNALMAQDKENKMDISAAQPQKKFTQEQLHPMFKGDTAQQLSLDNAAPQTQRVESVMPAENRDIGYSPNVELSSRVIMQTPKPAPKSDEEFSGNVILREETEPQSESFKYINDSSFEKPRAVFDTDPTASDEDPQSTTVIPTVIGEVFKTYIIVQAGDDMYMIDKHAAHERFIFEKIKSDVKSLDTQLLLEPVMVQLSFEEYDAINNALDIVSRTGFLIEPDVAPTVAVKGVPVFLSDIDPNDVVSEIAENLINSKNDPQLDILDELYHSVACKSAIKANDDSSFSELEVIVKAVFNNDNIRYCPHGRPVIIKLSKRDIEKQFKRIV